MVSISHGSGVCVWQVLCSYKHDKHVFVVSKSDGFRYKTLATRSLILCELYQVLGIGLATVDIRY